MWSISNSYPYYSMEGHAKGINCLDFYPGNDKPYLATGSDDFVPFSILSDVQTVKIWDYQTKTCIQTLTGHEDNLTAVKFHPRLPYLLSSGEDNRVIIFHSGTYRRERVILQPSLDRAWSIGLSSHNNHVVLGYDEGFCIYTMGRANPAISMDTQGRVVWSMRQEIWQGVIDGKQLNSEGALKGQEVTAATKSLGRCEVTPSLVSHNATGRFLAVVGEGEYVIYTSRQLRSKAYGEGTDLVWRPGSKDYCVQIVNICGNTNA